MWKNPNDGRFYLIGVVARGPDCPNRNKQPGAYTKVQVYLDSIKKIQNGEKLEYESMYTPKDAARIIIKNFVSRSIEEKND